MQIPDDLRYSTDHEWVRIEGGKARIGITDYAQDALGDVVFVDLPEVGAPSRQGSRSARSSPRSRCPTSTRRWPAPIAEVNARARRRARAPQRGPLRRRLDLRDRAGRRRRARRAARRRRLPSPRGGLSDPWPPSPARSAGTGTRSVRASARRAAASSIAGASTTTTMSVMVPLESRRATRSRSSSTSFPAGVGMLVVARGPNAGSRSRSTRTSPRRAATPTATIFLDDITVSRRHAEVGGWPMGYEVRDAGSLNGTYLNRERVERSPLNDGDELQIGKFKLRLPGGTACDRVADRPHLSIGEVLACCRRSSPTSPSPRSGSSRARACSTPSARRRATGSSTKATSNACGGSCATSVTTSFRSRSSRTGCEDSAARGLVVPPDEPMTGEGPGSQSLFDEPSESEPATASARTDDGPDFQPIPVPERAVRPTPPPAPTPEPPAAAPVVTTPAPWRRPWRRRRRNGRCHRRRGPRQPSRRSGRPRRPRVRPERRHRRPRPLVRSRRCPPPRRPASAVRSTPARPLRASRSTSWAVPVASTPMRWPTSMKFDLINGRKVGGDTFYDADELVVARMAAGFVQLRHRGPPPAACTRWPPIGRPASSSRWSCRC